MFKVFRFKRYVLRFECPIFNANVQIWTLHVNHFWTLYVQSESMSNSVEHYCSKLHAIKGDNSRIKYLNISCSNLFKQLLCSTDFSSYIQAVHKLHVMSVPCCFVTTYFVITCLFFIRSTWNLFQLFQFRRRPLCPNFINFGRQ